MRHRFLELEHNLFKNVSKGTNFYLTNTNSKFDVNDTMNKDKTNEVLLLMLIHTFSSDFDAQSDFGKKETLVPWNHSYLIYKICYNNFLVFFRIWKVRAEYWSRALFPRILIYVSHC